MTPVSASAVAARWRRQPGIRVHNPVLFSLVIVAILAALLGGFLTVAPNRLVSGAAVPLWSAAGLSTTIGVAGLLAALAAISFRAPSAGRRWTAAAAAAALLLLLLVAAGDAAKSLAAHGTPLARIGLGAGFWLLAAAAALMLVDALRRAGAGPAVQAGVALAIIGFFIVGARSGIFDSLSLIREYQGRRDLFAGALLRHVLLVVASIIPALLIGFPLGIAAARRRALRGPVFATLNLLQTIPSVALFGLLIVPLSALAAAAPIAAALGIGGIGPAPALIALVLYALLPVVRNTTAGIGGVDPGVVDAATGIGLTPRQIFWRIELPLAMPVLFAGLRIVTVQAIGLAVVAALIGAGGLGTFVFEGLGQYAIDLVLLGALPAIFLALAADFALRLLGDALSPVRPSNATGAAT